MCRATRAASACSLPTSWPVKPRLNVSSGRPEQLCGHRRDEAGIHAAAHERAERHVGDQHRLRPSAAARASSRSTAASASKRVLGHVRRAPERAGRELAVAHREPVARGQLAHRGSTRCAAPGCTGIRGRARSASRSSVARQAGERQQRLQLRAEDERARVPRVVERLDAEMVAREEELAPLAIPQREREHAGDAVEERPAPAPPAVDQHLAVAVGRERRSLRRRARARSSRKL